MKKHICLILALCMVCMLVSATAEGGAAGTWYLSEMTADGQTIDGASLSQIGMTWSLALGEDGSVTSVLDLMGEKEESAGTWTQDGDKITITIDDQPAEATLADGKLTLSEGGQTMVFTQEAPEAAAPATESTGVAADSEDAFLGDWELTAVGMMGMTVTKDMFAMANLDGFNITLTVEPGKATLTAQTSAESEAKSFNADTVLEDGKLVLNVAGTTIANITMQEDGSISFLFTLGSLELTVYMVRSGAAEAPAA